MPRDEVSWPCFSYKEGKELALISFRSAVVYVTCFCLQVTELEKGPAGGQAVPQSLGLVPCLQEKGDGDWVIYQILFLETRPKCFISLVVISFWF